MTESCKAFYWQIAVIGISELVLLQQLEEVLNLEAAIFGHVGAVNGVSNSV